MRGGLVRWLVVAALLTAFYSFRMIFMTFHGEFRGGGAKEIEDAASMGKPAPNAVTDEVHREESPLVMVVPMLVLGIAAVVAGYLANPQWVKSLLGIPGHWFSYYVESALLYRHAETAPFNWAAAGISTAVALAGIGLAYLVYARRKPAEARQAGDAADERPATEAVQASEQAEPVTEAAHGHGPIVAASPGPEPLARGGPVHTLLFRKYFVDELYEGLLVRRVFYRFFAGLIDWVDRNLVDATVDLSAWLTRQTGRLVAQVQTGQVQLYGAVIVLGAVLIVVGYLAFGTGIGE